MKTVTSLEDTGQTPHWWKKKPIVIRAVELVETVVVKTREGELKGFPGDFLIAGIKDEVYPCGREIFFKTYESVEGVEKT